MVSNPRSEAWQYFDNIAEEGIAVCKLCKQRIKSDRCWGLKQHLLRLHNAKVEVWNYFHTKTGQEVSVCKRCNKSVRNNHSSNLIQHLEVDHNIILFKSEEGTTKRKLPVQTSKRELRAKADHNIINLTGDDTNEEMPVQEYLENKQNTIIPVKLSYAHTGPNVEHAHSSAHIQTIASPQIHEYATQSIQNIAPNQTINNFVIQSAASIIPTQISNEYPIHNVQSITPIQELSRQSLQPTKPVISTVTVETSLNISEEKNICDISGLTVSKPKSPSGTVDQPKSSNTLLAIEMNKQIIMSAVWGLIIEDGLPPQIFGSKNMQTLIKPICESISNMEKTEFIIDEIKTEQLLSLVANHLRDEFSHDLNWRLLSLKVDMDIKGPPNTFCISTQYIDDGAIQSCNLGVIDLMNDSQLTEKHFQKILGKFNIDSNQIIRICCDNTKPKFNTVVNNSEYIKEFESFEKHPEIQFGDIMVERYIGSIAQLCLLDIFKNFNICKLFLECRNLVKFIGDNSNSFDEIFKANNLYMPQLDSPWKWGSTYEMMQKLLEARSILNNVKLPKLENPEDHFDANDNLWLFVEAFCESLSCLQKSILKYYNEEMHFGDFYAQWLKNKLLTAKLAHATNVENIHVTTISADLLKSIEARSKELLKRDCFEACLYLDPRFHHTLGTSEKTIASEYLKKLWSQSKVYKADVINTALQSQEEDSDSVICIDDEDAFLNEFLSKDIKETDTRTADVYRKIEELKLPFQSVDTNILMFWNQQKDIQPEIYTLSAICFAFPTTQNYNQNRYAHIYKTQPISKLSPLPSDDLVSIRLNSHLLEGNLEHFGIYHADKYSDDED